MFRKIVTYFCPYCGYTVTQVEEKKLPDRYCQNCGWKDKLAIVEYKIKNVKYRS